MLIDDSELYNYINEKTIRLSRFAPEIHIAYNVMDTIEKLTSLKDIKEAPGVIFIDLNMPVMSGYQVVEQLRLFQAGILKNTKLVILTSSLHEHDRELVRLLGDDIAFLTKALRPEMLFSL